MNDNFDDNFLNEQEEEKHIREPHRETAQEREEREIAESTIERRHNTVRTVLFLVAALLLLFLCWWLWARYIHAYEQGQYKGWILDVHTEGSVFTTYEGKLLTTFYADDEEVRRDTVAFTIIADSVAREAMRWSADGRRLVVDYGRYKGKLPWRGNTTCIVTAIEADSNRVEVLAPVQKAAESE
ncbi:MAG: hypothetical protein IJ808_00325 [Muribaculaceae bacterium]|nr:hypothetical protein [Muribaculaceae bacterium]